MSSCNCSTRTRQLPLLRYRRRSHASPRLTVTPRSPTPQLVREAAIWGEARPRRVGRRSCRCRHQRGHRCQRVREGIRWRQYGYLYSTWSSSAAPGSPLYDSATLSPEPVINDHQRVAVRPTGPVHNPLNDRGYIRGPLNLVAAIIDELKISAREPYAT
jgi:hypothetical protein